MHFYVYTLSNLLQIPGPTSDGRLEAEQPPRRPDEIRLAAVRDTSNTSATKPREERNNVTEHAGEPGGNAAVRMGAPWGSGKADSAESGSPHNGEEERQKSTAERDEKSRSRRGTARAKGSRKSHPTMIRQKQKDDGEARRAKRAKRKSRYQARKNRNSRRAGRHTMPERQRPEKKVKKEGRVKNLESASRMTRSQRSAKAKEQDILTDRTNDVKKAKRRVKSVGQLTSK